MKIPMRWIVVAGLALLGSCTPKAGPAPAAAPPRAVEKAPNAVFFPPESQEKQADAIKEQQYLIQVMAYKITVPAGTISRSDDFWKHINEQAVDVGTYELLYKNGIRVGVAPTQEWDGWLKPLIERHPVMTQRSAWTGREAKDLDMDLAQKVEYQNVFYYDNTGQLSGRTYERCDNLLRLSFQPAPRKHGSVRLAMCPVIKSLRERLVPIGDVNTRTIQRVYPEHLYDLNMAVDVPLDSFLIIAPSPEAKLPGLPGAAFLVNEGAAEQTETLLIFRPIIFRQHVEPVIGTNAIAPAGPKAPAPAVPTVAPSNAGDAATPAPADTSASPFKK